MAYPTTELIEGLRTAAASLRKGNPYSWGNHGSCNCGHLLQAVTELSPGEILRYAHTGVGEWTELATEYCGVTDAPVELLVSKLKAIGLTAVDIHQLEYLENRDVLKVLPGGFRWLKRNKREDVILYFEAFANLLERKLTSATLTTRQQKEVELQLQSTFCLPENR